MHCDGFLLTARILWSGDFVKWRSAGILYARIGPQWLSKLRWLWLSVPCQIVCELISLIGSHTIPGQHYQPNLTSLGHGCMHV